MQKGFTLIELLIVIGIIAVLSVVVLLTLNPAELLRQARDSNRLSDIGTLKSALALYLTDVSNTSMGAHANCYVSVASTVTLPTSPAGTDCGGRFDAVVPATETQVGAGALRNVDSTGWIPVNFGQISGGTPLAALPVDPTNSVAGTATSTAYFYAFRPGPSGCAANVCTEYELNAHMESQKFIYRGGADVESTDGGNETGYFEVGTDPGLNL